jgi:hypothetical protein
MYRELDVGGAVMREEAVLFGGAAPLVAVLTEPEPCGRQARLPAVILLNAGLIHRVGPHRICVRVARHLASLGLCTLRFDFSGIGDSPSRSDNLPFETSSVRETRQAMDYLESTRRIHDFVLVGICSGADAALRTACQDQRVVGVAAINGSFMDGVQSCRLSPYLESSIRRRYYRKYLLDRRRWGKLFTGKTRLLKAAGLAIRKTRALVHRRASAQPQTDLSADCRFLLDRGTRLLLVYAEGSSAWDAFHLTLKAGLAPWRESDRLRVEHIADADHIFTLLWSQELLTDLVRQWVHEAWMANHEP